MSYNERSDDGADHTAPPLTTHAEKDSDDMAGSKSSKAPAFQFYPSDFLSDPNVIVMSLAERGAYITLLCVCWQQGSLPIEQNRLARLCGVTLQAFKKLWPALDPCFRIRHSHVDRMINPRLERERLKQLDFKRRQSDNGSKGGRPHRNPTESQNKAAGFKIETQTEPKKSSSSSSLSSSSSPPSEKRVLRRAVYDGERLTVTHGQHEWLCKEYLDYVAQIDVLARYPVWDSERGTDDNDTLAYLKMRMDGAVRVLKSLAVEDVRAWCQHPNGCPNREFRVMSNPSKDMALSSFDLLRGRSASSARRRRRRADNRFTRGSGEPEDASGRRGHSDPS